MAPLVVDPCGYLKPHHSVGHCPSDSHHNGLNGPSQHPSITVPPGSSRPPTPTTA